LDEINLDASTAITFVAEGSPIRNALKAMVSGKQMVLTQTAEREFLRILKKYGGPKEQARAQRFLVRVRIIQDNPSARARALKTSRHLGANDIVILGTGDTMGIVTLTADRKALSAALSQGVNFNAFFHFSDQLKGI
jgi:hypothetical protein